MRYPDEFILDVLALRRSATPSYVARKLKITNLEVRKICQEIQSADIKTSTKKNVENLIDVMLHYPQV